MQPGKQPTLAELAITNEQAQLHFQAVKQAIVKCKASLMKASTQEAKKVIKETLKADIAGTTDALLKDAQLGTRSAFESAKDKSAELTEAFLKEGSIKVKLKPTEDVQTEVSQSIDKLYKQLNRTSKGFKKLDREVDKIFSSLEKSVEEGSTLSYRQICALVLSTLAIVIGLASVHSATIPLISNVFINSELRSTELIYTHAHTALLRDGLLFIGIGLTGNVANLISLNVKDVSSEELSKFYENNIATLVSSLKEFEKELPKEVKETYQQQSTEFRKQVEEQKAQEPGVRGLQ